MSNPDVAIVIPTLRRPDELTRALRSIFAQQNVESRLREIIVADNDPEASARASGADSVILGCTEIGLLLDPDTLPLPGYDSTILHADAAVRFALDDAAAQAA